MLAGLVTKLLFTSSIVQVLIVLFLFSIGMYFLMKKQLFWKIYAYVFALFAVVYSVGFTFDEYDLYDYIWIPLIILSSIAIFGLAYNKVIFNRLFWILLLFVIGLDLILPYGNTSSIFEDLEEFGMVLGTIYLLFIAYFMIPMYVGLFKYSFYSDDIWKDSNSNDATILNE